MTGQRTIGRQAETRRFARTRPAKGQRGGGQKGRPLGKSKGSVGERAIPATKGKKARNPTMQRIWSDRTIGVRKWKTGAIFEDAARPVPTGHTRPVLKSLERHTRKWVRRLDFDQSPGPSGAEATT